MIHVCNECCDKFEKEHQLKIDTRQKVQAGIFFGSNKTILKTEKNATFEVKGFKKVFGFQYIPKILEYWLKELMNSKNFIKEQNKFYNSMFESFIKVKNSEFSLSDWVDIERNEKGQFLYYLPKNKPTHSMGFPKKHGNSTNLSLAPFPTQLEYFQEHSIELKEIQKNLDFSSYWHFFCQTCFKGNFISYINVSLSEQIDHGMVVSEAFDYTNQRLFLLQKESFVYQKLNEFANWGLFSYFKSRNKKNFTNLRKSNLDKSGILYKDGNCEMNYGEFMLKKIPNYFVLSAALTIDLEFTWETSFILCFDCDHIDKLFYLTNENCYILKCLIKAKKHGSVLFSSPTNTPFDRFKVLIQVEKSKHSYKEVKTLFEQSIFSHVFSLEQKASILGVRWFIYCPVCKI